LCCPHVFARTSSVTVLITKILTMRARAHTHTHCAIAVAIRCQYLLIANAPANLTQWLPELAQACAAMYGVVGAGIGLMRFATASTPTRINVCGDNPAQLLRRVLLFYGEDSGYAIDAQLERR
jgi:hypothetical protein